MYEKTHMIGVGPQQEKRWYYFCYKKGKQEDQENNRPVSLASVPGQGGLHMP